MRTTWCSHGVDANKDQSYFYMSRRAARARATLSVTTAQVRAVAEETGPPPLAARRSTACASSASATSGACRAFCPAQMLVDAHPDGWWWASTSHRPTSTCRLWRTKYGKMAALVRGGQESGYNVLVVEQARQPARTAGSGAPGDVWIAGDLSRRMHAHAPDGASAPPAVDSAVTVGAAKARLIRHDELQRRSRPGRVWCLYDGGRVPGRRQQADAAG